MEQETQDKFGWLREIIRANVVSKLRGRNYANVLDIGVSSGQLLHQLREIFKDSRFYAHPLKEGVEATNLDSDVRILKTIEEVKSSRYDLILSVFDIHIFNWLQVGEYMKNLSAASNEDTTILVSDICANTITASLMLKAAALFNSRLKSVISQDQAVELLEEYDFVVVDKDLYKINDVWSAWIITCKKKAPQTS